MSGVIWSVQLVQYPLFARVGAEAWPPYHDLHRERITFVVAVPMLVELVSAAWLAFAPPADVSAGWAWAGLGCAVAVWAATLGLAGPDHERLARGWDAAVGRRLLRLNWIRTVAWTAHAVVALGLLAQAG